MLEVKQLWGKSLSLSNLTIHHYAFLATSVFTIDVRDERNAYPTPDHELSLSLMMDNGHKTATDTVMADPLASGINSLLQKGEFLWPSKIFHIANHKDRVLPTQPKLGCVPFAPQGQVTAEQELSYHSQTILDDSSHHAGLCHQLQEECFAAQSMNAVSQPAPTFMCHECMLVAGTHGSVVPADPAN